MLFQASWPKAAERWEWSVRPRLIAPDCELVLLFDGSAFPARHRASAVPAVKLFMRYTGERWLVAGVNEEPPELQVGPSTSS